MHVCRGGERTSLQLHTHASLLQMEAGFSQEQVERLAAHLASLCRLEKIPSGTLSMRLWSRLSVLTLTNKATVSQGTSTRLL